MELSLKRPTMSLCACAEKFGQRMQPHLSAFRNCSKLAFEVSESRADPGPLDSQVDLLDDTLDALPQSDVLFHHITALCSAGAAFGCVSSENPSEHIKIVYDDTAASINALREMNDSSHSLFANAVHTVFDALTDWVKKNLQGGRISHVTASASSALSASTTDTSTAISSEAPDSPHTAPHLVDYKVNVIGKVVKSFKLSAEKLGGRAEQIAMPAAKAFNEIYDFLVAASERPIPPADDEKQKMISKIVAHMGTVASLSSECSPGDKHCNHVKAVEEAMSMVSWIVATEKPISFITDADGASSFYLNKILTITKKAPDAASHKSFVNALKSLFSVMKEYVKEHHTMGVRYGIGTRAAQNVARSTMTSAVSPALAEEDGNDYVSAFKNILKGPLMTYVAASEALGAEVAEQAVLFEAAWKAEASFLARAISSPKPTPEELQQLLAPIAEKMGNVSSVSEKVDPRGTFAMHCSAVGESVGALGWIAVEEKATGFVGDMAGAGQFFMDKVKMNAKKTSEPDRHREWAKALESLFTDLKAYVKEYHTQALVWNPPKRPAGGNPCSNLTKPESGTKTLDYVQAFRALTSGPLAAFLLASGTLGGEVQEQAVAFAGAWEAEADFLANALVTPKPDDVQELLSPIAAKMGEVASIVEKVDPRGPFSQHCNAVGESVAALGWVAVEEKATAFVGDMAGAGQFFLDKVKMDSKKASDPEAHRKWAKCLEELYAELKAYVKEYHTQKLVWNPPKVRKVSTARADEQTQRATSRFDYVAAFGDIMTGPLVTFTSVSNAIGGEVAEQARALAAAWEAERDFLSKAINMAKPTDVSEMIAPLANKMSKVAVMVEKVGPRSPVSQHCNAVGESVGALGWVAVDEKATAYVGDMSGAGQFYIDKVKMDAKKTTNAAAHRAWAQALEDLLASLKAYVRDYHTQKLAWKSS